VYCPFVCTALTRTPTEKIATTEQALRVAFIAAFYFSWGVGDLLPRKALWLGGSLALHHVSSTAPG